MLKFPSSGAFFKIVVNTFVGMIAGWKSGTLKPVLLTHESLLPSVATIVNVSPFLIK